MMKRTMAYYYLPNGESLHRKERAKNWGVDPDIGVDLTPDQLTSLLKHLRDNDIIPASAKKDAAATAPAGAEKDKDKDKSDSPDTQLETALLMMRLQLVQSGA